MRAVTAAAPVLRLEACLVALGVRLALRLTSMATLLELLARLPYRRPTQTVHACVDAARFAAKRAAHPTCLFESLIAFALLARRGHQPRLIVGVQRVPDFAAHAWLALGANALGAPSAPHAVIWEFVSPPRSH